MTTMLLVLIVVLQLMSLWLDVRTWQGLQQAAGSLKARLATIRRKQTDEDAPGDEIVRGVATTPLPKIRVPRMEGDTLTLLLMHDGVLEHEVSLHGVGAATNSYAYHGKDYYRVQEQQEGVWEYSRP